MEEKAKRKTMMKLVSAPIYNGIGSQKPFFVSCLAIALFFILITSVTAIPQTINLHGKLTDSDGDRLEGLFNVTFRIYDSNTGGSMLWEIINQTIETDSEGIYSTYLTEVNLTFDQDYFLGMKVMSDTEMTPRINLSSSPYTFRANVSDFLDSSKNYEIRNLSVGKQIMFASGAGIVNTVGDLFTIYGSVNITNDLYTGNLTLVDITGCSGKLYTDSEGKVQCGVDLFNTPQDIIDVVNESSLNASNFWGYLWSNVVDKLFDSVDNRYLTVITGMLTLDETVLNTTIDARDTNETPRVDDLYGRLQYVNDTQQVLNSQYTSHL